MSSHGQHLHDLPHLQGAQSLGLERLDKVYDLLESDSQIQALREDGGEGA